MLSRDSIFRLALESEEHVQALFLKFRSVAFRTGLHVEHGLEVYRQKPFCILVFHDLFDPFVIHARILAAVVHPDQFIVSEEHDMLESLRQVLP